MLPVFSDLPSMVIVTSKSLSPTLLAPTLIWMLICGGWACGANEPGAFGFSNERSLVYCASTLSWGGAASGGEPLPLVIECLLERFGELGLLKKELSVGASGYHSPACVHKDDNYGEATAPAWLVR